MMTLKSYVNNIKYGNLMPYDYAMAKDFEYIINTRKEGNNKKNCNIVAQKYSEKISTIFK